MGRPLLLALCGCTLIPLEMPNSGPLRMPRGLVMNTEALMRLVGVALALLFLAAFGLVVAAVAPVLMLAGWFGGGGAPGATASAPTVAHALGPPSAGLTLLWEPLVASGLQGSGVPVAVGLADVEQASGGVYLQGLTTAHPRTPPAANVGAGMAALRVSGWQTDAALVAAAQGFERFAVYAWPLGGGERAGVWSAPQPWLLITATGTQGPPRTIAGWTWGHAVAPVAVAATLDGAPMPVEASGRAPAALRRYAPPGASYWWAPLPKTGGAVRVSGTWHVMTHRVVPVCSPVVRHPGECVVTGTKTVTTTVTKTVATTLHVR